MSRKPSDATPLWSIPQAAAEYWVDACQRSIETGGQPVRL